MKYFLSLSCCIIMFAVIVSFLPVNGESEIYENMIRLHVIANSDDEADQQLKLRVRDAVLETLSGELDKEDKNQAEREIRDMLPEIEKAASEVVSSEGYSYPVKVEMGKEQYPIRYYENFVLPEGTYSSLRVIIGSGNGHNWWCVLYPPMCTAASVEECEQDFIAAGFSGEQYKLIKKDSPKKYKVRFAILEMLSEAFGFDY